MSINRRKDKLRQARKILGEVLFRETNHDVAIHIQEALLKLEKAQHEMER